MKRLISRICVRSSGWFVWMQGRPALSEARGTRSPVYRDAEPVSADASASTASVGDLKWSEVFKDEQLKELISEALAKNFDVRIAAQHVLEQQAQVGITRSQSLPSLSAGGAYSAIGIPTNALGSNYPSTFHGGGLIADAAWNLDFWGLYRRQNEAERAKLLATEWGRRATLSSVVINVADLLYPITNAGCEIGDYAQDTGFTQGIASACQSP
jgi:multidrug efflux system outer membrane protein